MARIIRNNHASGKAEGQKPLKWWGVSVHHMRVLTENPERIPDISPG
jgi:hypothetical protein